MQIFCEQPVIGNLHIFSFSWLKISNMQNFVKILHIWNGMVKGFSKMYNILFFGQIFFCKLFYFKTGFCDKNSIFGNLQFFLQILKVEHKRLSSDILFVIFWHKTWDLEVGVKLTPPQHILVFKYPAGIGLKHKEKTLS